MQVDRWLRTNSFHHSRFPFGERTQTVTVCLPALDEAATIGEIVAVLDRQRRSGTVDEVVVVDGGSTDGTPEIAEACGARVLVAAELLPTFGPVLGKGDGMWRALSAIDTDIVCFLDADSGGFGPHFSSGLVGPLLRRPELVFTKAQFRRPLATADGVQATGGGRVTELTARPALRLFFPLLAGFRQPLAGEIAARRSVLNRLPFATGYAVETAMLIDVVAAHGLRATAQVDLDVRHNDHQELENLAPMADAVLAVIADRLHLDGRLLQDVWAAGPEALDAAPGDRSARPPVVRPPLDSLAAAAAYGGP
ncbi:MAG: glucosyl-3-phosphoglycerate synthase [Solirubrobacterales bacterium]